MKNEFDMNENWQRLKSETSPELLEALRSAYDFFDGRSIVRWLANLYDPEIGGFYYSNSARDFEPFRPDIESTNFAINILQGNGAIKYRSEDLPAEFLKKIIAFIKSLQCPDDGYFYHPQWPQGRENLQTDRYGRDMSKACELIASIQLDEDGSGVKRRQYPNYCVPGYLQCARHAGTDEHCVFCSEEKKSDNVAPAKPRANHPDYSSEEAFLAWVTAYNGGESVKDNSGNAHNLEAIRYEIYGKGYLHTLLDYLDRIEEEIFDEQIAAGVTPTGVFQREVNYRAVWAFYKYTALYTLDPERPRAVKQKFIPYILDTYIKVINMPSDGNYQINDVMNQWIGIQRLIGMAKKHYGDDEAEMIYAKVRESAPSLILNTIEKLKSFKVEDGSFAFNPDGTTLARIYGTPVSHGGREGDVNSTLLALNTYRCMFQCMGYTPVQLFDESDKDVFNEIVSNVTAPKKKTQI